MVKIVLVGVIVALVYSQPDLRLTVADWLRAASDLLIESVQVKPWVELKLRTIKYLKQQSFV